jgi:hypothetical protein
MAAISMTLSARPSSGTPSAFSTRGGVVLLKTFASIRLSPISIPSIRVARYQSKKAASALLRHVRSASLDRSLRHPASRMIARKDGAKVRLYSRPGNDLTYRFSLIVEALAPFQGRRNYSQPSEMAAP